MSIQTTYTPGTIVKSRFMYFLRTYKQCNSDKPLYETIICAVELWKNMTNEEKALYEENKNENEKKISQISLKCPCKSLNKTSLSSEGTCTNKDTFEKKYIAKKPRKCKANCKNKKKRNVKEKKLPKKVKRCIKRRKCDTSDCHSITSDSRTSGISTQYSECESSLVDHSRKSTTTGSVSLVTTCTENDSASDYSCETKNKYNNLSTTSYTSTNKTSETDSTYTTYSSQSSQNSRNEKRKINNAGWKRKPNTSCKQKRKDSGYKPKRNYSRGKPNSKSNRNINLGNRSTVSFNGSETGSFRPPSSGSNLDLSPKGKPRLMYDVPKALRQIIESQRNATESVSLISSERKRSFSGSRKSISHENLSSPIKRKRKCNPGTKPIKQNIGTKRKQTCNTMKKGKCNGQRKRTLMRNEKAQWSNSKSASMESIEY